VFIHFCGVITESLLHKENLIGTMFRGTKSADTESASVRPHRLVATTMITVIAAYVIATFGGYLTETADQPYLPFKGPELVQNELWQEECSDCHFAFHPSLLPARSWQLIFKQQNEHFDDDLDLDEETVTELLAYATANSADQEQIEPAWRMNSSIASNDTPLRITDVRYWKRKHEEIAADVWKRSSVKSKANCAACHLDAEQGTFEDADMRIPGENKLDSIEWLKSVLGHASK